MINLESEYFTEYKSVEKICNEMYNGNGIQDYIDDMYNYANQGRRYFNNWDGQLQRIKYLRRLRNQIAHENGSYEVTEQDVNDIQEFHRQLLTQQDPLAVLYKETEKAKKLQQEQKRLQSKLIKNEPQIYKLDANNTKNNRKSKRRKIIIASVSIAVAVVIAVTLFYFLH